MKDRISITMLDGGIADVRLIRADKMNALDPAMWDALAEAVDTLKAMSGPARRRAVGRGARLLRRTRPVEPEQ